MDNNSQKSSSVVKKLKHTMKKLNQKRNSINQSVINKTKKIFKKEKSDSLSEKNEKSKPSSNFVNTMINRNIVDTIIHKSVLAELKVKYPHFNEEQLNTKADQLTNDIMNNPLFLQKLIKFEEDSERYAFNDGVASLKDALAFIPEVGAVADIGIDIATKYLPQTYFTYQNIESIKDIYNDSMSEPIDMSDVEKKTSDNSSPTFADRYKKAISQIKYQ